MDENEFKLAVLRFLQERGRRDKELAMHIELGVSQVALALKQEEIESLKGLVEVESEPETLTVAPGDIDG